MSELLEEMEKLFPSNFGEDFCGVLEFEWEKLAQDDKWGQIATEMQKLPKVRQQFVRLSDPIWKDMNQSTPGTLNKTDMDLRELRFEETKNTAGERAVWLIVMWWTEPTGPISKKAEFTCSISSKMPGDHPLEHKSDDIPASVQSIVDIDYGLRTFALLCLRTKHECLTGFETLTVELKSKDKHTPFQSVVWTTNKPKVSPGAV